MSRFPTAAQPVLSPNSERIIALDVLRGISVLGILLMNIVAFGLPNAYYDPTLAGGAEGANLVVWACTSLFVEGVFRGIFTLLFGAGVVLYTQRLERAGAKSTALYYRRTLWLIVFGLLDAYLLLWFGDILFLYGLVGLLLYAFRRLPVRKLLLIAIPFLCMQTVSGIQTYKHFSALEQKVTAFEQEEAAGKVLSSYQRHKIKFYEDWLANDKPSESDQAEYTDWMRDSYASAFESAAEETFYMQTDYIISQGFWEVMGMMLLGMALLKLGFLTAQWSVRSYAWVLGAGWGVGLLVNALEVGWQIEQGFQVKSLMLASLVTYDLGRIPMTLGHVAAIMLLFKSGALRGLLKVFASTGQMALTNYLAQSAICLFLFTGAGLAWFGQLERYQLYFIVFIVWILQLIWSHWWLSRFRFGPMEWVWRSLTRWQRQPLRRNVIRRDAQFDTECPPRIL